MSAKHHFQTAQTAYKKLFGDEPIGYRVIIEQLRTNLERSGKTYADLEPGAASEKVQAAIDAAYKGDFKPLNTLRPPAP
jgi:hypothetical protein